MPKLEVFVSHRTVEAKFADTLRTNLGRDFIGILNFFVSTDVTSVPAGSQWFQEAMLLERARTRLVVIASGDSLALATLLLSLTNVISPRDIISAKAMAGWVQTSYAALRTETLADACELAAAQSGASMKLLSQQVVSPIKMTWEAGGEAASS